MPSPEKTKRNQRIVHARLDGASMREIGDKFGISHVRVIKILRREEEREWFRDGGRLDVVA